MFHRLADDRDYSRYRVTIGQLTRRFGVVPIVHSKITRIHVAPENSQLHAHTYLFSRRCVSVSDRSHSCSSNERIFLGSETKLALISENRVSRVRRGGTVPLSARFSCGLSSIISKDTRVHRRPRVTIMICRRRRPPRLHDLPRQLTLTLIYRPENKINSDIRRSRKINTRRSRLPREPTAESPSTAALCASILINRNRG